MSSRASKSKPSARWGGTGMRAHGVWLQIMMWDAGVIPKVTGCRTPRAMLGCASTDGIDRRLTAL